MKKIILNIVLLFSIISLANAQNVIPNDSNYYSGNPVLYIQTSAKKQQGVIGCGYKPLVKITNGYQLISTDVYFSGTGFSDTYKVLLNGSSTAPITALLNRVNIGTSITFDNIKAKDSTGKIKTIEGCTFKFFEDTVIVSRSQQNANQDLYKLLNHNYTSGNIYFSGTNFKSIVSLKAIESKSNKANDYLSKATIGTTVIFENCIYKDLKTQKLQVVNISIKVN
jgi:hypothetical protein